MRAVVFLSGVNLGSQAWFGAGPIAPCNTPTGATSRPPATLWTLV